MNSEPVKIHRSLYISDVPGKGRGVFSSMNLEENTTIEISPVLLLNAQERLDVEKTPLNFYVFEWEPEKKNCCVAWGYLSMYNHSFDSNCEYFMDIEAQTMTIKTVKPIPKGTELTINYNGDFDNKSELWFPTI